MSVLTLRIDVITAGQRMTSIERAAPPLGHAPYPTRPPPWRARSASEGHRDQLGRRKLPRRSRGGGHRPPGVCPPGWHRGAAFRLASGEAGSIVSEHGGVGRPGHLARFRFVRSRPAQSGGSPGCRQGEATIATWNETAGSTWPGRERAIRQAETGIDAAIGSGASGAVESVLTALSNNFASLYGTAISEASSTYGQLATTIATESQELATECGTG